MFKAVKLFLGKYTTPILAFLFIGLIVTNIITAKLYEGAISEKAKVEEELKDQTAKVAAQKEQIDAERSAGESLIESNKVITERFEDIEEEIQNATHEDDGDISIDATLTILCANGMADAGACKN